MSEPTAPHAEALAADIRAVGEHAHTEEDVRIGVELLLRPILGQLGISYTPAYERHYRALLKGEGGQSDAVYGHAIIEYEPPGSFRTARGVNHAQDQLERYLKAEATRSVAKKEDVLRRSVGIALDGERIFFVRYRGKAAPSAEPEPLLAETQLPLIDMPEPPGIFRREGLREVATDSIAQFLVYLRALRRRELTPERLADAFGPKGDIARQVVRALLEAFKKSDDKRVKTLYSEWDRIFGIVYGQEVSKAVRDARELARLYNAPLDADLKPLLFVVHTYFALIMKLLAAELVSLQGGYLLARPIADLPSLPSDELRRWLRDLEDGGLFARQEVHNFLEGDFFGWYLSAWNPELEAAIREMARTLSEYEPATGSLLPEATRDLLKKLYQYLIPREIRHDLGEYYTPDWLAELVLNEVGYKGQPALRLLDPACGSGTFLVLAIRRAREMADDNVEDPKHTAQQILSNIMGFDLNPLAVIAARTNYLLALGTLVRHKRPLEIPVYLCDSILTPSTYAPQSAKGADAWLEPYIVPTVVGDFHIPRGFATKERLEGLMRLLEDCVTVPGYEADSFLERVTREVGTVDENSPRILRNLFQQVTKLEQQGRNGIWARLLKNRFAPVFVGRFDLVVGNPPWVNWESLSDEYRQATQTLWQRYGLFSLKGQAARLGGGKKDLSMLMLYASADNYLKDGGRLGFVITQSVFKTKGAGDGFRRFRLGDGSYLQVETVLDLAALQPFEGASNRTAVIALKKGDQTAYPLSYVLWRKTQPGRITPDTLLEDVRKVTDEVRLVAQPVDAGSVTSPWLTTSAAALDTLQKTRGRCEYRAHKGAYCSPNGVYWVRVVGRRDDGLLLVSNESDIGKKTVSAVEAQPVEPEYVFPLLRGRDTAKWFAKPSLHILMVQDVSARAGIPARQLAVEAPHLYRYLSKFEPLLRQSASFRKYFDPTKDAFYSMYDVAQYTLSPVKVVWREIASRPNAAVVTQALTPFIGSKPVIPDHKLILVPFQNEAEAHYFCAIVNCVVTELHVAALSGFYPSAIDDIQVSTYDPANPAHRRLSLLSMKAHELAPNGEKALSRLRSIEQQIDHSAASLWGISDFDLREIRRCLQHF